MEHPLETQLRKILTKPISKHTRIQTILDAALTAQRIELKVISTNVVRVNVDAHEFFIEGPDVKSCIRTILPTFIWLLDPTDKLNVYGGEGKYRYLSQGNWVELDIQLSNKNSDVSLLISCARPFEEKE